MRENSKKNRKAKLQPKEKKKTQIKPRDGKTNEPPAWREPPRVVSLQLQNPKQRVTQVAAISASLQDRDFSVVSQKKRIEEKKENEKKQKSL